MHALSSVYGTAATWRRRWYSRDPARLQRLARPVISVGNLRVGGAGKTPVVAYLAQALLARGERPSILTRGYARAQPRDGVTVVSDGSRLLEGVTSAGDEPFMLARALPGVPVLVAADRFESGTLAERRFGVTVHVLDDGFQHVRLARDVDLLLVDASDLVDHVLPAGRLREPLANAAVADAALVTSEDPADARRVAAALGISRAFLVARRQHAARNLTAASSPIAADEPVVAFAGIARPERFFADLERAGWRIREKAVFPDHHRYGRSDLDRLVARARQVGATRLMTTEKDAVRLSGVTLPDLPIAFVPLSATIEPADEFLVWLAGRLRPLAS